MHQRASEAGTDGRARLVAAITGVAVDFLHLFIAMYISELLVKTPVFGGAAYVSGQFWVAFTRLYGKRMVGSLPLSIRARAVVLFAASLVLDVALIFIYPWVTTRIESLVILLAVVLLLLRQAVTDYLAARLSHPLGRGGWLFVAHALFIALGMLLFDSSVQTAEYYAAFACVAIAGLPLMAKQLYLSAPVSPKAPPTDPDRVMAVSSYRIYNGMVTNLLVAVNLSMAVYICYIRYLPYSGIVSSFLGLVIWMTYLVLITGLFCMVLRRREKSQYDKPTLFIAGALMWIAEAILTYRGTISLTGYGMYLFGAVFGFGLACMLSIILTMGGEMKSVIELSVDGFDDVAFERSTQVTIEWSVVLSWFILQLLLTFASFVMDGRMATMEAGVQAPWFLQWLSFNLPVILVAAAMILVLAQPLDGQYAEKLRAYQRQRENGEHNKPLEERLKKVLITGPKRVGIQFIKMLFWFFLPMRIVGRENADAAEKPLVFVCNHYELYGPIAAVVRLPYYFRPWIINSVLDEEIIAESLRNGVDYVVPFLPEKARKWLSRKLTPFVLWVFHSLDPIPVYRESGRDVIKTIRLTVEALECDENILIFPENPASEKDGRYAHDGVSEFFTGFSSIGQAYYQKTGRRVTFIPVYIDKKRRLLMIGEGVQFDPDRSRGDEKARIAKELRAEMSKMAINEKGSVAG